MRRKRRLMGMKQILVVFAAVVLVGQSVVGDEKLIADPIVEEKIRGDILKPKGELTHVDLAKVTYLNFTRTKITDEGLKELVKLQELVELYFFYTKVTKAGAAELKKALPNCRIFGP